MDIHCGDIIWADAPDHNGFIKDRPMVVLAISSVYSLPLVCCCISTKDLQPRPQTYFAIPWDPSGRSKTGLKEKSFAVADWIITVSRNAIRRKSGKVAIKQLNAILDLVAAFKK